MSTVSLTVKDDFDYILGFLPNRWEENAKKLGALTRCRKIPNAKTLLQILLIHLAEGCSLRETSVRAKIGNILTISDVAIMDRLRCSSEWFRWMNTELIHRWICKTPVTVYGNEWNIRIVDGTRIKEPGPTGSSWNIHYSIALPSLFCTEIFISEPRGGKGESFKHFHVSKGDLFMGDRAYGVRPSIGHVVNNGGDVVVRFSLSALPLQTKEGDAFNLLSHLRKLTANTIGDWDVLVPFEEGSIQGRVCAIKKSKQAAESSQKKVKRQAQKNGTKKIKPETLEAAKYTFVFTTAARKLLNKTNVLEMYRGRWQVELVFKRLKSIIGLGHLRKIDKESSLAWIQGKLFVALLIEALIQKGESFFPWGYPIYEDCK